MSDRDRQQILCTPFVSDRPPITKEFYNPASVLPRPSLSRALDLEHQLTIVSPYHRDVMTVMLRMALCLKGCELDQVGQLSTQVEAGLFQVYNQTFNEYAFNGARLLLLFARSTEVSRFALSLNQRLFDGELDPVIVADVSDEELFPELFDNRFLDPATKEYLVDQFDNEHDSMWMIYVRSVLSSLPPEELSNYSLFGPRSLYNKVVSAGQALVAPVADTEICFDQGERYCFDLVELLERFAADDYINPLTGKRFSPLVEEALKQRFHPQIAMLKHYLLSKL